MDISSMRQTYKDVCLDRDQLNSDPFNQFEIWFEEANKAESTPNAMSLATVCSSGVPSLRTVLLKIFDKNGFVFFTNYKSKKATQLKQNKNVAILFNWVALERQVGIEGEAEKIDKKESLKYFLSRPRGSQLGAWVSNQSSILDSREELELKLEKIKNRFSEKKEIPLPGFWGGFRIKPLRFEFWQGRSNRLHDRFLYSRIKENSWEIKRLSP